MLVLKYEFTSSTISGFLDVSLSIPIFFTDRAPIIIEKTKFHEVD